MDMMRNEKYIHRLFDISLILKGAHSIIEIIGGFVVLFISQDFITRMVLSITQEELSDDPTDAFANYLIHLAQSFSISSQHFIAFYLLSHGIVKGFLVYNLFKEKLWAYPLAIVVFTLFGIYQIFEFFHRGSLWLLALTVLDIIVIALTWHEYRYMEKTGIKPKWDSEEKAL
ncbi:MAG TPA: DUF2127 domain-containing protein [Candidatus Paceibacterota bacterium]|jgi:uncharacterized membrane protein|nr:DUF2127 domain-containing protein [Candidatus Paceibacterota bacterium]